MSTEVESPVVRFAPSPTGALHIGGARTALYNWLVARSRGGRMILRIEDTDLERSTTANVDQIIDALRWLELDWDEGPVSQASRRERHDERIAELLDSGRAYHDRAMGDDVKAWRERNPGRGYRGEPDPDGVGAVRLRVPDEGETVVEDLLRGPVRFENRLADDLVIARGDGTPLYNFAVAVDDVEMGVTEVIRGDDHLSNTPKQQQVIEALGATAPTYAHLPLLHGPDGKKLSKRHGAASVQELRAAGYLPAAIRNYLALLGWGTDDDTTLMSTEELLSRFRIEDVGRSSAVFDERKLRWMNGRFLREMPLEDYTDAVAEYLEREAGGAPADRARLAEALEPAQEKAQTLAEVWPLVRFVFEPPVSDERAWAKVMGKDGAPERLAAADAALRALPSWDLTAIEAGLESLLAEHDWKPGSVYQPIRVAITGSTVSPGIFESLAVLGREPSLERIAAALSRF
ncbi:glutamate--tRNA ligase [Thermoleophilia bacterium SCSIO 60948]|nr:glutamate--tRNA ligase [Thermoleophilia bacterium SCSIO 60948]